MNWRNFKTDSEGFKGLKGFKPPEPPPIKPLKHLKPAEGILKNDAPATAEELHLLLGKALAEIDLGGRPWSGWRRSLTEPQRQALRVVEQRIDLACLTLDRPGLIAALAEHKRLTLNEKKTHI